MRALISNAVAETELVDRLRYSLAMPTYFFHVLDGENLLEDDEGKYLSDLEAVEKVAIQGVREQIDTLLSRAKMFCIDGFSSGTWPGKRSSRSPTRTSRS
jgi:hypothetical protein